LPDHHETSPCVRWSDERVFPWPWRTRPAFGKVS
jgi:hypothetical protein